MKSVKRSNIKSIINVILTGLIMLQFISCMPSKPYEIKSPCVSSDADGFALNPCVRRPLTSIS